MTRRAIVALLAVIFTWGVVPAAKADVSGGFDIQIALFTVAGQTESLAAEAVELLIDLQSNLVINVTLSGMTLGTDLGFGNTGVEFAILSLAAQIGPFSIFDEFVFATPFYHSGSNTGPQLHPTSSAADEMNTAGFVKKRVMLELNIAGFTLENLAIFEDVDFPVPGTYTNPIYHLGDLNNAVDDQTPTFGFGDVVTLSGQTISGITVKSVTNLCTSGSNNIKKRSWMWAVNKACTASLGNEVTPIEQGAKTPLLFEREELSLSGIKLGEVTLSVTSTFTPLMPVAATISASFNLLALANVSVTLNTDHLTALSLSSVSATISASNLTITLTDAQGDLSFDTASISLATVFNPNQNPVNLAIAVALGQGGITSALFSTFISRGAFSFIVSTSFSGAGELAWASTTFGMQVRGDVLSMSIDLGYAPNGMNKANIILGMDF